MLKDKIKGMFIAGFLGDALGAPHEFRSSAYTVYTGKLEHAPIFTNRFGNTNRLDVAEFTDTFINYERGSVCILSKLIYISKYILVLRNDL